MEIIYFRIWDEIKKESRSFDNFVYIITSPNFRGGGGRGSGGVLVLLGTLAPTGSICWDTRATLV